MYIKMPETVSHLLLPATNKVFKGADGSAKTASAVDKVDLSDLSKRMALEIRKFAEDSLAKITDKEAEQVAPQQVLNNDEIEALIEQVSELGKPYSKPADKDIDDFHWGAVVNAGLSMGISDSDVMAQLTTEDVELYFYTAKGRVDDDTFWKSVFKTDDEGNFLKENGSAVRNEKFMAELRKEHPFAKMLEKYSVTSISASGIGGAEHVSSTGSANPVKLVDAAPEHVMNLTRAVDSGVAETFLYAMTHVSGSKNKLANEELNEALKIAHYNERIYNAMKLFNDSSGIAPDALQGLLYKPLNIKV